jgi:capsular polysaccharide export protein
MMLKGPLQAHGFSWRKRALLRQFTQREDIHFLSSNEPISPGKDLLLWGAAAVPRGVDPAANRVIRVEDGFLRSIGLGADLVRPISWVLDTTGLHFDASRPSDLENLLGNTAFCENELKRASKFRHRLVTNEISKYNLVGNPWRRPPDARLVLLVVGQVESDASIAFGSPEIKTNLDLLQAVREARPEALLVYKPHPDVVAGLRASGTGDLEAQRWADLVLPDSSPSQLLTQVDEVHVMTSLLGFEALLRDTKVFCYGQPFYAGWGLTQDLHPIARRTRRLTLDALVAGSLLQYPTYLSSTTNLLCTPEEALEELITKKERSRVDTPWWRRAIRPLIAQK